MLIQPLPPQACATAFATELPMFLPGAPGLVKQSYLGGKVAIPSEKQLGTAPPVPQQVFQLSLNAAANNSGTIHPPSVGWRFLAGHGPTESVLGRMVQNPSTKAWKLTGVFFGERVWAAYVASESLSALPEAAKDDYELRVLAVPGLNLEAFWLVAQTAGSVDLIVPFPQGLDQIIPSLRAQNPYKLVTFLALIRPLAGGLLTMAAGYGA
jgi:hypothetical protein